MVDVQPFVARGAKAFDRVFKMLRLFDVCCDAIGLQIQPLKDAAAESTSQCVQLFLPCQDVFHLNTVTITSEQPYPNPKD